MKENKKNKNASKKLVTLASVGLSSAVAFAVAAPLIINAQNSSSKNVSQQPKLALVPISTTSTVLKGIEKQKNNVAPRYLYSLPILDSKVVNALASSDDMFKLLKYVAFAQTGAEIWGLTEEASIADAYSDAASAIALNYANISGNIQLSSANNSKFTSAKNLFTDRNEVAKNYKVINNIGDNVDYKSDLSITKPEEVRSVASSKPEQGGNVLSVQNPAADYLMNRDNFEYKVADIDLEQLRSQGSLVFKYKDKAQTDNNQHDYRIVISNENKEIDKFLTSGNGDISSLVENQTFFIRDKASTASKPKSSGDYSNDAKQFINDKFRFVYDKNTSKLSLLIKPDDNNIGANGIEIGIDQAASNKSAIQSTTTKWGFLDNTLAPDHIKALQTLEPTGQDIKDFLQNPVDLTKPMVVDANVSKIVSSSLSVFSAKAQWKQNDTNYTYTGGAGKIVGSGVNGNTGANWLRVFLGKQTKIAQEIQFAGSSNADNFEEGSARELSIQYLGGDSIPPAVVSPKTGFVIRKEAEANAKVDLKNSQRFAVLSSVLENPHLPKSYDDSYLVTDIVFNRGITSFAATSAGDEADFDVPNIAQKIFFENPFSIPQNTAAPTLLAEPRTSPQVVVTDQGKKFIANVMQNWTYKSDITAPSDKILSFKDLVELFKQTNKADFDDLDHHITVLKDAQAANDTVTEATEQAAVDAAAAKIYKYFPKWPFGDNASLADPKDSDMIFDDSVAPGNTTTLDAFVYKYRRFYVNDLNNIAEDAGSTRTHGLYKVDSYDSSNGIYAQNTDSNAPNYKADITFDWALDSAGNKVAIEATGEEIYKHFRAYTAEMIRWQKDKLGIDATMGIGNDNPYAPQQSGIMGWVQQTLISRSGDDGAKLNLVASVLSKIWVSPSVALQPEEQDVLDEITTNGILPNGWEQDVIDIGDPSNKSIYPSGQIDETNPHYLISKQYIYIVLQAYFIKMLNRILEIETQQLEDNKMLSLRETFKKFFADTADVEKINEDTIKSIDTQGTDIEKLKLVGVQGYGTATAKNGFESLKSLLTFVYNSGLQQRFLDDAVSIDHFNKFMEAGTNGGIDDPQLLIDESKKNTFKEIMNSASKIINKTFNKNQTFTSISEIMNKMDSGTYDHAVDGVTPLADLKKTIKAVIATISASTSGYNKLQVFGAEANYTYLQSLTMGKNLNSIFNEYISRKKAENLAANKPENDSLKQVIDFVHESKEYNEKAIASLAVSLGYYNLEYFVENLTNPNKVATMARELLSKDLSKDIQLKVDDSNQLVNIISQPGSLAKYAFLGIGASTALIGGSIFGLSFRKSVRTSRKNIIMERAIFVGIAVLGIALALFGIIPGIL